MKLGDIRRVTSVLETAIPLLKYRVIMEVQKELEKKGKMHNIESISRAIDRAFMTDLLTLADIEEMWEAENGD
jgi:hypothetical protein